MLINNLHIFRFKRVSTSVLVQKNTLEHNETMIFEWISDGTINARRQKFHFF